VSLTLLTGYILDSDAIITLCRRINPPEARQTALDIVENIAASGRIKSPQEVYLELNRGSHDPGDAVVRWCNDHRTIFEDLTEDVQFNLQRVLSQFDDLVKVDLGSLDADPILIAMALDNGWTVVSRDGRPLSGPLSGVHAACHHFDIRCITEYEFLKENGWVA
jgi:hypothetical protein